MQNFIITCLQIVEPGLLHGREEVVDAVELRREVRLRLEVRREALGADHLRHQGPVAEHQHDGYIPLKEIAARQEISEKYLEAIVKSLVKERYLTGLRGKSGGYRLTKAPEEYTVGSILRLSEGSLAPVACLEQNPVECRRMAECRTLPMWRKLNTMINDYFDGITLADLVNTSQPGNDYVI